MRWMWMNRRKQNLHLDFGMRCYFVLSDGTLEIRGLVGDDMVVDTFHGEAVNLFEIVMQALGKSDDQAT